MNAGAISLAVLLPTLLVAHQVADHWAQTGPQATTKGLNGTREATRRGQLACLRHVAIYTLILTTTVLALWWAFNLPIHWRGVLIGQAVSATTHYWSDRQYTLARLAARLGKRELHQLGAPRAVAARTQSGELVYLRTADGELVPWDNPSLDTGAYVLDQSWHWAWLAVTALITALA